MRNTTEICPIIWGKKRKNVISALKNNPESNKKQSSYTEILANWRNNKIEKASLK